MKYIILFFAFILTGCAHQDKWSKRDTALQIGVTLLFVADAYITTQIQYHPDVHETGVAKQFIGDQPSTSDTYLYFGVSIITNYLISRALSVKWRPYWQGGSIVYSGLYVKSNCDLGLCSSKTTEEGERK